MRHVLLAAGLISVAALSAPSVRADETAAVKAAPSGDWSEQQTAKLPQSEKPVHLFNGRDFAGWEGRADPYWSVVEGVIVATNTAQNGPKASTYLLTAKSYRDFRLIFEAKLVTSEMHSGIALWGRKFADHGENFGYQGHLVMFPSDYGFWDLNRRNMIYKDAGRVAKKAGKQHDWNRMEILAIGHRIRFVINGTPAADWSDPKPELCQPGPIGLQLHANRQAQEVHFRGLILTENPADRVITAAK